MSSSVQCPRCGSVVDGLQSLDPGTAKSLSERNGEQIPAQVCMPCYRQLVSGSKESAAAGAAGSALMAQERAKENRKLMLWKSRVNLIKRARMYMGQKAFSEAAVAYEKYVRVLEVVFETNPGGLTPEQFKDSARTQELTVVASVFWDLLRIYDTSERYGDRQTLAAQKLAQFLRFTPIYPDIIRKAESFSRTARNPAVIRGFLKSATETKGRCFVATSAFHDESAFEVVALRAFRDQFLQKNAAGRCFIRVYERWSPLAARWLDRNPKAKPFVRALLRPCAALSRIALPLLVRSYFKGVS